jgi:hypothetical protein
MISLRNYLDVFILLFVLITFLYVAIFRNARSMFIFFVLCLLWSTSVAWTKYLPNADVIFSERPGTNFPGYLVTLGGIIYGIPLTTIAFISLIVKRHKERMRNRT